MKTFIGYFLFIAALVFLFMNPVTGHFMFAVGVLYEYALYIVIGGITVLLLVGGILERRKG